MDDGKLAKEQVLFAQNEQTKTNHSSLGCYALNKPGENPSIDGTGTPPVTILLKGMQPLLFNVIVHS